MKDGDYSAPYATRERRSRTRPIVPARLDPALRAAAARVHAVLQHAVADPLDEQRSAAGAVRVLPAAHGSGQVAGVDEAQALGGARLGRAQQRAHRGGRAVLHAVVRMEGRHVPGDVGRDRDQEARDVPELLDRVVEARHDERHHLEPEALLVERADRPGDALERAAEVAVGPVAEALQVHLVERDPGPDVLEHLLGAVAVRDVGAHEPLGLRVAEDLDRPLARDQRLVVGRGHDPGARALRGAHDLRRSHRLGGRRGRLVPERLRGDPVLAVAAVIVAAEHAEGQRPGARQRVEERLLLDRVELQAGHVAERAP